MRCWLPVFLALCVGVAVANEDTHTYTEGESVTLWVGKLGPYHNPQETYDYYSLPFCRPEQPVKKSSPGLGAGLERGGQLQDGGVKMNFKVPQTKAFQCEVTVNKDLKEKFYHAVNEHYWYQLYIDELPVWGMVGQMMVAEYENEDGTREVKEQAFIYTHRIFSLSYNENQIIEVNLTSDNPRPLVEGRKLTFTVSVNWKPTREPFETRFNRYLDFNFFENSIHWFSIFNSFMMVVFLCGLVVLILLRTLRNDFVRYASEENQIDMEHVIDESGWKQVHGDVFRPPPFLSLFSALVGAGTQVFCVLLSIVFLFFVGWLSIEEPASTPSTAIAVYCISSLIAGYFSGSYFKLNGGTKWKHTMILTAALWPGISGVVVFVLNAVASLYHSSATVDAGTLLVLGVIWLLIALPLCAVGTVVGRSTTTAKKFPCPVHRTVRPIPDAPWYANATLLAVLTGVLPFGSIFIEMYFVFMSFWNYKVYYLFGFLLLVFLLLTIVVLCVTIVSSYLFLNSEDYRWHWFSYCAGGSTSLYVYLYSLYYFFAKSNMYGVFQVIFFFGYMALVCSTLFLVCGAIGFFGVRVFVGKLYQYIKSD